ncbi:MAG: hypothetical protein P1V51_20015 [Deltaproteobacteria bacterium]|nr:hypothetical protein [Deltaproteobacteria bacterium]
MKACEEKLVPMVAALKGHPSWDAAEKLLALDGIKRGACPHDCLDICAFGQEEIFRDAQAKGIVFGGAA